MRASLLLVLTAAILVGLGVVILVRQSGLFRPAVVNPVVEERKVIPPRPSILVAAHGVYKGDAMLAADLSIRPLRLDEMADYESHKDKYLKPSFAAAVLRFAAKDIEADRPLRLDDLEPMRKPESLSDRLPPGTKAVNIGVEKVDAAGGQLAVGDWVDVYLTTRVGRTDSANNAPRTGLLVKAALVVAKRNTLWPIYSPLPDNEPIYHTLAVNPYRAALLEYSRGVGTLALVAIGKEEKAALDLRKKQLVDASRVVSLTYPDAESPAYQEETKRVLESTRGTNIIGPDDLMAVFGLRPLMPAAPPTSVEFFTGTRKTGSTTFGSPGAAESGSPNYTFTPPPIVESKTKPKTGGVTTPSKPKAPKPALQASTPKTVLVDPSGK